MVIILFIFLINFLVWIFIFFRNNSKMVDHYMETNIRMKRRCANFLSQRMTNNTKLEKNYESDHEMREPETELKIEKNIEKMSHKRKFSHKRWRRENEMYKKSGIFNGATFSGNVNIHKQMIKNLT